MNRAYNFILWTIYFTKTYKWCKQILYIEFLLTGNLFVLRCTKIAVWFQNTLWGWALQPSGAGLEYPLFNCWSHHILPHWSMFFPLPYLSIGLKIVQGMSQLMTHNSPPPTFIFGFHYRFLDFYYTSSFPFTKIGFTIKSQVPCHLKTNVSFFHFFW